MQKEKELFCEKCNSQIVKSYGSEYKLRAKLIKWDSDGMFAVCKSCGHEESINSEILKSMSSHFSYEIDEKN